MLTEANFCFEGKDESNQYFESAEFGTPDGAAYFFWNMHCEIQNNPDIDLATAFATAEDNDILDKVTRDWSTELDDGFLLFRYCIDLNGQVIASKLADLEDDKYKVIFKGHYAEFINQYDDSLLHFSNYERFYKLGSSAIKLAHRPYMTLSEIKSKIDQIQHRLLCFKNKQDAQDLIIWLDEYRRCIKLFKQRLIFFKIT